MPEDFSVGSLNQQPTSSPAPLTVDGPEDFSIGAVTPPKPKVRRVIKSSFDTDEAVNRHAQRTGLDPKLIKAVMHQESGSNPGAVSPKGARGLMQLMPGTAARFGVTDPHDPEQSIKGGTDYLKFLSDRYKGDLDKVLAGYNAGEGAVDKFAKRGKAVPYRETRNYVKSIKANYKQTQEPAEDFSIGQVDAPAPATVPAETTQPAPVTPVAAPPKPASRPANISSNDISWHYGMAPDEFASLSAISQQRVLKGTARAIANDETKKKKGDKLTPSLSYINDNRKKLGLQPKSVMATSLPQQEDEGTSPYDIRPFIRKAIKETPRYNYPGTMVGTENAVPLKEGLQQLADEREVADFQQQADSIPFIGRLTPQELNRFAGKAERAIAGLADYADRLPHPGRKDGPNLTQQISEYLKRRSGIALSKGDYESPDVIASIPKTAIKAFADAGMDLAALLAITKSTGLPFPVVMAGEAALNNSDKSKKEIAYEASKAFALGKAYEYLPGKIASKLKVTGQVGTRALGAGLFGGAAGAETALRGGDARQVISQTVAQGTMGAAFGPHDVIVKDAAVPEGVRKATSAERKSIVRGESDLEVIKPETFRAKLNRKAADILEKTAEPVEAKPEPAETPAVPLKPRVRKPKAKVVEEPAKPEVKEPQDWMTLSPKEKEAVTEQVKLEQENPVKPKPAKIDILKEPKAEAKSASVKAASETELQGQYRRAQEQVKAFKAAANKEESGVGPAHQALEQANKRAKGLGMRLSAETKAAAEKAKLTARIEEGLNASKSAKSTSVAVASGKPARPTAKVAEREAPEVQKPAVKSKAKSNGEVKPQPAAEGPVTFDKWFAKGGKEVERMLDAVADKPGSEAWPEEVKSAFYSKWHKDNIVKAPAPDYLRTPKAVEKPVEAPAEYSNNGREVSQKDADLLSKAGAAIVTRSEAAPREHVQPLNNKTLKTISDSIKKEWGGTSFNLRNNKPHDGKKGFAGGVIPNEQTIRIPIADALVPRKLASALTQARTKFKDYLGRPDHYLGVFRDDKKGTVTIEPTIILKTKSQAEALATHLKSDGGVYDYSTGDGVFPVRVKANGNGSKPSEKVPTISDKKVAKKPEIKAEKPKKEIISEPTKEESAKAESPKQKKKKSNPPKHFTEQDIDQIEGMRKRGLDDKAIADELTNRRGKEYSAADVSLAHLDGKGGSPSASDSIKLPKEMPGVYTTDERGYRQYAPEIQNLKATTTAAHHYDGKAVWINDSLLARLEDSKVIPSKEGFKLAGQLLQPSQVKHAIGTWEFSKRPEMRAFAQTLETVGDYGKFGSKKPVVIVVASPERSFDDSVGTRAHELTHERDWTAGKGKLSVDSIPEEARNTLEADLEPFRKAIDEGNGARVYSTVPTSYLASEAMAHLAGGHWRNLDVSDTVMHKAFESVIRTLAEHNIDTRTIVEEAIYHEAKTIAERITGEVAAGRAQAAGGKAEGSAGDNRPLHTDLQGEGPAGSGRSAQRGNEQLASIEKRVEKSVKKDRDDDSKPHGGPDELTPFTRLTRRQRAFLAKNPYHQGEVDWFRDRPDETPIQTVGKHLEEVTASKYGSPMPTSGKDSREARITRYVEVMSPALKYQQEMQGNSRAKFYKEDSVITNRGLLAVFPELSDPIKMKAFKALISPTSFGFNPVDNMSAAVRIYEATEGFTKPIPVVNPENGLNWTSRPATKGILERYNRLIEQKGLDGFVDFISNKQSPADINASNPRARLPKTADEFGSAIMGPKGGPFFQNNTGNLNEYTADMWEARGWNRAQGNMFKENGELIGAPRNESERAEMREATNRLRDELNLGRAAENKLTTAETQALHWVYEQQLYKAHGADVETLYYSDGIRKVLKERGISESVLDARSVRASSGKESKASGKFKGQEGFLNIGDIVKTAVRGAAKATVKLTAEEAKPEVKAKEPLEKERSFPKTAVKAGHTEAMDLTYTEQSNEQSRAIAQARIDKDGPEKAMRELAQATDIGAEDIATGILLAKKFQKDGNAKDEVAVIDDLARKLTKAGQVVQAASMVNSLSPEGALLRATRILKKKDPEARMSNAMAGKVKGMAQNIQEAKAKVVEYTAKEERLKKGEGSVSDKLEAQLLVKANAAREKLKALTQQAGSFFRAEKLPPSLARNLSLYADIGAYEFSKLKGENKMKRWKAEMVKVDPRLEPFLNREIFKESFGKYDTARKTALQASREKSAQKTNPAAKPGELQAIINEKLAAQTRARRESIAMQKYYNELGATEFRKKLRVAGDVIGLYRALEATADLSGSLRQTKAAILRHPLVWAKAFAKQIKGFNTKQYDKMLSELELDPDFKHANRFGLDLTGFGEHEEGFQSGIARKIPGSKHAEQAYTIMLDYTRMGWFKQYAEGLRRLGLDPDNPADAHHFEKGAQLINNATGRGDWGKDGAGKLLRSGSHAASQVLFSPRFWASRMSLLKTAVDPRVMLNPKVIGATAKDVLGMRRSALSNEARVESFKTIASFTALVGMQLALAKMTGAKVSLDIDDPDFLKASWGKYHVDFSAGMQGNIRMLLRTMSAIKNGDQGGAGGRESAGGIQADFWRKKLSPAASMIVDMGFMKQTKGFGLDWQGQDFLKNPEYMFGKPGSGANRINPLSKDGSILLSKLVPMVIGDAKSAIYDTTPDAGTAPAIAGSILGEGVQVYDAKKPKSRGRLMF